jgi:hypothetical protein
MTRRFIVATSLIFSAGLLVLTMPKAGAEIATSPAVTQDIVKHGMTADEFSAQSRRILRRAPSRVRVYRRLGPNSVRVCNAHYEQEFRPSGTVIVPRMNCYWRG